MDAHQSYGILIVSFQYGYTVENAKSEEAGSLVKSYVIHGTHGTFHPMTVEIFRYSGNLTRD